jgi:hypothetical protein
VQPADCETVSCVPATLIVPLLAGPPAGDTEKEIPPLPMPEVGPVRVIHDESLAALHEHPEAASIVALPLPPCAPNECVSGSTATVQPPPWVNVTSWPATSTLPVRVGPLVPSTTIWAAPDPLPLEPWTTAAQGTLLAAVHGQPAAVETFTIVEPPPAPGA